MTTQKESWHIDRRIPIALLAALMLQAAGFAFWVGTVATRVDTIEGWIADNRKIDSRLAVVESKLTSIEGILLRLADQRVSERGRP